MVQKDMLRLKIHYGIGRRRKMLWLLTHFVPRFQFILMFLQILQNTGKHWNKLEHHHEMGKTWRFSMLKKCPYLGFFWSIFSRIRTEYWDTEFLYVFSRNTEKYGPEKLEQRYFLRSVSDSLSLTYT